MLRGNRLWPGNHLLAGKQCGGPYSPDKPAISLLRPVHKLLHLLCCQQQRQQPRVGKANKMKVRILAMLTLFFEGAKAGKKLCAFLPGKAARGRPVKHIPWRRGRNYFWVCVEG